jgi:succinate dehydrogenase / fumarate reductase, membrane anchor subunit
MSVRNPLAKVKHLGSAKSGTEHFVHQRLTAVFMIPLMIWFVLTALCFYTKPMDEIPLMVTSPLNIIASILFIGVFLYHASIGIRVVLEDYVHCKMLLNLSLGVLYLVCWLSLIAGVCSVLSIHLLTRIMF